MKNKKMIISIALVAIIIATGIIWFNTIAYIGSSNIFTESGGCISFSFDKRDITSVNKVVVSNGDKEVVIEDKALVDLVVNETKVATHIGGSCPEDKKIELYSGDTLIRSMGWSSCSDTVRVYNADDAHWVFSIEGLEDAGEIYLSDSLVKKLNDLLS